ncbi:MAG: DUF6850 family outer membrane beta-barrel protein [Bacteroidales bacterium]
MIRKYIPALVLITLCNQAIYAQGQKDKEKREPLTLEERDVEVNKRTWGQTQNAAGIMMDPYMENGQTEFSGYLSGGDYHRSQEGDGKNGIVFKTDRFDRINDKVWVWGSFRFDMNRETNRAWSDVISTYNSSPFSFGSSIPASYDSQMFDFKAKVGYNLKSNLKLGLGIDYLVGDVSRLRDPRTRTYLADYGINPALVYVLNDQHSFGLTGAFRYRKDKMPSVMTVQENPDFKYYPMLGLENGEEPRLNDGAQSGNGIERGFNGFRRQYVSSFFGGSLQYAYKTDELSWITSAGILYENQEVLGDVKRSPGEFFADNFDFSSQLQLTKGEFLHEISLSGAYKRGFANEFIQSLNEVRDPVSGIVSKEWITNFVYTKQYELNTTAFNIDYKLSSIDPKGGYRWYVGAHSEFNSFKNQYNLPLSYLKTAHMQAQINGGYRVWKKNNHAVTFEACIGGLKSLKSDLLLNNTENDLAKNIWIPDANYYKVNNFNWRAEANYSFPIRTSKVTLSGYLRIFSEQKISDSKFYGSWMTNGIALGIITL